MVKIQLVMLPSGSAQHALRSASFSSKSPGPLPQTVPPAHSKSVLFFSKHIPSLHPSSVLVATPIASQTCVDPASFPINYCMMYDILFVH